MVPLSAHFHLFAACVTKDRLGILTHGSTDRAMLPDEILIKDLLKS
jgi:hypothetical protein